MTLYSFQKCVCTYFFLEDLGLVVTVSASLSMAGSESVLTEAWVGSLFSYSTHSKSELDPLERSTTKLSFEILSTRLRFPSRVELVVFGLIVRMNFKS